MIGQARHHEPLQETVTLGLHAGQRIEPCERRLDAVALNQLASLSLDFRPVAGIAVAIRGHGQRRHGLARFEVAHDGVPGDPLERRVVGEWRAVAERKPLDARQSLEKQRKVRAQQFAPRVVGRADVIERDVLEVLQVEPEMIHAFHERTFDALEQFVPLLLQHEPLHLLAQLGARRCQARVQRGIRRRHIVQGVPPNAACDTHRRQIAVFLIAQPCRHRAGLIEQIARRCDRSARCTCGSGRLRHRHVRAHVAHRFILVPEAGRKRMQARTGGIGPRSRAGDEHVERRHRALEIHGCEVSATVQRLDHSRGRQHFQRRPLCLGPGRQQGLAEPVDQ